MKDSFFPLYSLNFVTVFLLTVIGERVFIPILKGRGSQPIYLEGPSWHEKKKGTPTMGGLAFLIAICFSLLAASFVLFSIGKRESGVSLLLSLSFSALNSAVGIFDDLKKLKRKRNAGLSPMQKLVFQFLLAAAFLYARAALLNKGTSLLFSFGEIELGIVYFPLGLITLVGVTNFANLTDGIDGLASSVAFAVGISLFYLSYGLCPEGGFISSAIVGASVAFMLFNLYPAKIFMGDTGSLLLGSLAVSGVFALENPLLIVFIGGVYFIEGISVVLQVVYYKITKKRLFKMAPFHHHLEKCGWTENKICIGAIILSFILSIPAIILYF